MITEEKLASLDKIRAEAFIQREEMLYGDYAAKLSSAISQLQSALNNLRDKEEKTK